MNNKWLDNSIGFSSFTSFRFQQVACVFWWKLHPFGIWVHSCPMECNNSLRLSISQHMPCTTLMVQFLLFQIYNIYIYQCIYIHSWILCRNTLGWPGMIHGAILEWRHCNKVCRSWNGLFGQLSKTWGVNYKLCICNQIHDQDSTLFRAVSTMHTTFAAGNKPLAGIDISDLTFVFLQ